MVEIRRATSDDIGSIRQCAREAYAIYVERIGREPAPMVADFASQIARDIVYVAEDERSVLGFVVFYPRSDHMHLENLAVHTKAQGQGVGAQLIGFVEAETLRQNLPTIELYTNEKMTENIPYYLARGYVETGRWEEDGFNRIFFRKCL